MNHTQYTAIDARAEQERAEAELEDCRIAFSALAENAASAYAVLAAVIRQQLTEIASTFPQSTDAQMVDTLILELSEDRLIEALGCDETEQESN